MSRIAPVLRASILAVAVLVAGGCADDEPRQAARATATPVPADPGAAVRDIDDADVERHLRALADAASRNGGTRAAGTPGDRATTAYVEGRLRAAGWRVTRQRVDFPYFDETRPPRVTPAGSSAPLRAPEDIRTLGYSRGGVVEGSVRALRRGPDAGCRPADFARVRRGDVALVDRGVCTLRVKAANAARAGAAAVVIVNPQPETFAGTLGSPGIAIPVLGASPTAGRALAGAPSVRIDVAATSEMRRTDNVIAEAGTGRRVAMAGGHHDSVAQGPGMNDNASGVAALLAVAERLGGKAPEGRRIRLGFWGAEELGLYGSRRYVRSLPSSARRAITGYVNLDMVGTPDGRMAVYDADRAIRRILRAELRRAGHERIADERLGGASDHAPFDRAGIPVGGIFTGLDRCYHRRCDVAGNVDADTTADAAVATGAVLLARR
jgi:aminopeptidase Y